MRGAPIASLLAALVLLAGCVEPTAPPDDDEGPGEVGPDGEVLAPEWQIGDHWSYDSPTGPFTLVVTSEQGGDWVMDTTTPELALFHALNDVSYLGPVRKTDLAGSQGGDRVQYFSFPLEDEKTWTTRWDERSVEITATETREGRFELVAMEGSRLYIAYVYDAATRFFESATWYSEDGEIDWEMKLTQKGKAFTGTLMRYEIGETRAIVHGVDGSGLQEIEIAEQWNEIGLRAVLLCSDDPAGQILLGVNSPNAPESPLPMLPELNEPEEGYSLDCSEAPRGDRSWVMPNPGGTWEVGIIVAAPNGLAHLFLQERAREEFVYP